MEREKNPNAVALGRNGGKKGGPARAANMSAKQRTESARNAVLARWAKSKSNSLTSDSQESCYAFCVEGHRGPEQECAMQERKTKIPFPTPTSPLVDAVEVSVKESTERWTEVLLEDGSVVRIKPSVMSAVRIVGQFDPEGNPLYALRASQVMLIASAPDDLRRPKQEAKVQ